MSERAEVYRINKGNLILNFNSGQVPEYLRGIDNSQQNNMNRKIEFLETSNDTKLINNSFTFLKYPRLKGSNNQSVESIEHKGPSSKLFIGEILFEKIEKKTVDESIILNSIKDAWKDNENKNSKINTFKMNITQKDTLTNAKNLEKLNKLIQKNEKEDLGIFNL